MNANWLRLLPSFIRNRLEGRLVLQKILANTGWLLVDKAIRLGLGLVVGVWVARYLGPANYGILNYAIAFVALFSALANVGLDSVVVRDIVRDAHNREAILGSAFALKIIGGLVALICSVIAILLLKNEDSLLISIIAISAVSLIFQAFDTVDLWFQSQLQSQWSVLARNTAFILIAAAKVVLILVHAPLIAFAWAGLVEAFLAATALIIAYRLNRPRVLTWRISARRMGALLSESWPLIFSGIVVTIYMRIDQVMLGHMLGNESVGIYSAATRLSELWYILPTAIVASVAPSIVKARDFSASTYRQQLQRLFRLMVLISYAVALPVSFLAEPLVILVFGSDYAGAGDVLAIHIWASIFVALGIASSQFLLMERQNSVVLQRTLLGGIVNIFLNLLWIPRYGVVGAAWATLVSYGVANFFLLHNRTTRECMSMMLRALWPFALPTKNV